MDGTGRPLVLSILPGSYAVCRLPAGDDPPGWATARQAGAEAFLSVTRTSDELSIVCRQELVPAGLRSEPGWRCLKVQGPFAFTEVGIVASLASALAREGVSLFVVSTYDTDYLLVKAETLDRAVMVLSREGHEVVSET